MFMKRAGLMIAVVVAAAAVPSAASSSQASPAQPAAYPAGAFSPLSSTPGIDSLLAAGGNESDTLQPPAVAATAPCNFYTLGDYVHRSSTTNEASGHGWWQNINCPVALADVTVQLQQYYSDGTWRNRGTVGRSRVASGGGSGSRATGRATCNSSATTGWRSVIDVDLVSYPDSPEKLQTYSQNFGCRN